MLVHIVTPANRSAYAGYLAQMFEQRRKIFVENCGMSPKVIRAEDRDETDNAREIEYLLTFNEFGDLVDSSRMVPTIGPHVLSGALKDCVQQPYERTSKVWEWTRCAPITSAAGLNAKANRAFMLCAVQEWALGRGATRIVGIFDEVNLACAAKLGVRSRPLGLPTFLLPHGAATAVEFEISDESLKATRQAWGITRPATYVAPPPATQAPITEEEVAILDAVMGFTAQERREALDMFQKVSERF